MITTVIAIAIAKAIDPLLILAVMLMCALVKNVYLRLTAAVAIGCGYQALIINTSANPIWHSSAPEIMAAIIAALFWAFIGIAIAKYLLPWAEQHFPRKQPFRGLAIGLLGLVALAVIIAPGAILATKRDPASVSRPQ